MMATATRTQRRYDHRLRNLVRTTRDIYCAVQRGVPRSTARGWLTKPDAPVVIVDAVDMDASQLQREVLQLRRRIQKLTALLRVLLVVFRISGYSLNQLRLPEGGNKRSLLQAIERSRSALPLRSLLRVVSCRRCGITLGAGKTPALSTISRPAHDPRGSNSRLLRLA